MTLEELLNLDVDTLDQWTDKQFVEFFAPYLDFTRPERESAKCKEGSTNSATQGQSKELTKKLQNIDPGRLAMLKATAAATGIDLKKLLGGGR